MTLLTRTARHSLAPLIVAVAALSSCGRIGYTTTGAGDGEPGDAGAGDARVVDIGSGGGGAASASTGDAATGGPVGGDADVGSAATMDGGGGEAGISDVADAGRPAVVDAGPCDPAGVLCGGLIGHWRLDGDATDELGGLDGESMDQAGNSIFASALPYVDGPAGLAADFSGDSGSGMQHIRVASDAAGDRTPGTLDPENLSLAFWVRRPAAAGLSDTAEYVVGKGRICTAFYGCRMTAVDRLTCAINDGLGWCSASVNAPAVTIADDEWQHIVFTVKRDVAPVGLHLRVYLDGVVEASLDLAEEHAVGAGIDLTQSLLMGRNYIYKADGSPETNETAPQRFGGQLSDVRLYDGALTAAEVSTLFGAM